jgi:hypothetical protein
VDDLFLYPARPRPSNPAQTRCRDARPVRPSTRRHIYLTHNTLRSSVGPRLGVAATHSSPLSQSSNLPNLPNSTNSTNPTPRPRPQTPLPQQNIPIHGVSHKTAASPQQQTSRGLGRRRHRHPRYTRHPPIFCRAVGPAIKCAVIAIPTASRFDGERWHTVGGGAYGSLTHGYTIQAATLRLYGYAVPRHLIYLTHNQLRCAFRR